MNKYILYYTCNTHKLDIENACRNQLLKADLPIVSVSRDKEIDFGDMRLVLLGERSPLMMHRQVLAGLGILPLGTIVYLCESDVLYHPSHFDFTPTKNDVFYFNTNVWKVRYEDGLAVWTDDLQQVSGICADRDLLFEFYLNRVQQIEKEGFNRHYEPNKRYNSKVENYLSEYPNVDIRHENTITASKWSIDQFRNKEFSKGWKETDYIEGWGSTQSILESVKNING